MIRSTTLTATQTRTLSTTDLTVTSDGYTWDDLARDHWSRLVGYARKKGCSDPESVAGEVLADAYASRDRFAGTSYEFGKWLYTIAFRRITDTQRRWYASPEVLTDSPADTAVSPVVASPEIIYDDHETAASAFAALDILSARDRQIIEARIIDEQPVKVVAERLGLSQGAVRVYQSRALNKLRAHLDRLPSVGGGLLVLRRPFSRRPGPFADWLSEAASAGTFTAGTHSAAVTVSAAAASAVSAGSAVGLAAGLAAAVAITAVTAAPFAPGDGATLAPRVQVDGTVARSTMPAPHPDSDIDSVARIGIVAAPGEAMVSMIPVVSPASLVATLGVWSELSGATVLDEADEPTNDILEATTDTTGSVVGDLPETPETDGAVSSVPSTDPTGHAQTTSDSADQPTIAGQPSDGGILPVLEVTAID
ncbi:MAG: sigma-70 family RNA polymerase sigma factor [Acidimicrobiia bacterium]